MNRTFPVLFASLAMFIAFPISVFAETIPIYIDGRQLETDVPAVFVDGNTLAPFRVVFEAFGASVEWNEETQTATGKTSTKTVNLSLDSKTAFIDGQPYLLPLAPQVINGRIMVPLRFVAESLGAVANYNVGSGEIQISYQDNQIGSQDIANEGTAENDAAVPLFQDMLEKGKNVKELSYSIITIEEGKETLTAKVYIKNKNLRMEVSDPQMGNLVIINNSGKNESYFYNPAEKMAYQKSLDSSKDADIPNPENLMKEADSASSKFKGEIVLDGKKAYGYEYDDREGPTIVWLWADNGIPLKFEGTVDGKKTIIEFLNVRVGGIDDTMFELPPEVTTFTE